MNTLFLTLILSLSLVAIALLLLSFRVLFVRGGRFPSPHIGHSKPLRQKGITCAHGD